MTLGVWAPSLALAALVGAATRPVLAVRLAPFLIVAYTQVVIAGNIERLAFSAVPAVLWLAAVGLERVQRDAGGAVVAALVMVPLVSTVVVGPVRTSLAATAAEVTALAVVGGGAWIVAARRRAEPARSVVRLSR